jgi:hypothetical protein
MADTGNAAPGGLPIASDIRQRGEAMIIIYGASDHLVEVEGCLGADEFSASSGQTDQIAWRGDLVGPDGDQMRVHLFYDGCWHPGVGQVGQDVPLPPWPVSLISGCGVSATDARAGVARLYPANSVALLIDAPAATRLTNMWPSPAKGLNAGMRTQQDRCCGLLDLTAAAGPAGSRSSVVR